MKTLKALVISKSVDECLTAYPKIILIKEQDVRQFKSANFRLPKTHCQFAGPKNSADLRPQADGSAVGTSLAATPRSSTMSKSSIRFRRLDPRCYRCFFPPFPAAMAAKAAAESSRSVHITRVELDTRVHNVRCCAWPQDKCRAAVMVTSSFKD